MTLMSLVAVDEGADEVPVAVVEVAVPAVVEVPEGAAPVAAALKASNLSPGLIANTIPPAEQWVP